MVRRTKLLVSFMEFQAAEDENEEELQSQTTWQQLVNCFLSCYRRIMFARVDVDDGD
jgi:hypothetical protein